MLTLGDFSECVTELDSQGSIIDAFTAVKLIGDIDATEDDVNRIASMYVRQQMSHMPLSKRKFRNALKDLMENLRNLLIDGTTNVGPLPKTLEADMIVENQGRFEEILRSRLLTLTETLQLANITPDFPAAERVLEEDFDFEPRLQRSPQQSEGSFAEQSRGFALCQSAINKYINREPFDCVLMLGAPGSGKTHVGLLAITYALARRLTAQMTAIRHTAVVGSAAYTFMSCLICLPKAIRVTSIFGWKTVSSS
jgi:hypothetical protein